MVGHTIRNEPFLGRTVTPAPDFGDTAELRLRLDLSLSSRLRSSSRCSLSGMSSSASPGSERGRGIQSRIRCGRGTVPHVSGGSSSRPSGGGEHGDRVREEHALPLPVPVWVLVWVWVWVWVWVLVLLGSKGCASSEVQGEESRELKGDALALAPIIVVVIAGARRPTTMGRLWLWLWGRRSSSSSSSSSASPMGACRDKGGDSMRGKQGVE